MNLNFALFNDLVEVIGISLDNWILIVECACTDNKISQYEQTMTITCKGGDPNKYPNEKDMQPFFYSLAE